MLNFEILKWTPEIQSLLFLSISIRYDPELLYINFLLKPSFSLSDFFLIYRNWFQWNFLLTCKFKKCSVFHLTPGWNGFEKKNRAQKTNPFFLWRAHFWYYKKTLKQRNRMGAFWENREKVLENGHFIESLTKIIILTHLIA